MRASPVADPDALGSMELFRGLSLTALGEVSANARLRRLAKDTIIFEQGDRAQRCHALIEGRVRVAQSGDDGQQLVIRFIGPGEMFGTVALFTDGLYPAAAAAVIDCLEISWTKSALLDLIGRHPQIAVNLVKIIGRRIREVQERLRELATQRVERRVAHALLRLAAQAGLATAAGTAIDFPLTRKDVAEMSGTTLHTVSRILSAWEKAGLVVSDRRRVTVRRLAAIEQIAADLPD